MNKKKYFIITISLIVILIISVAIYALNNSPKSRRVTLNGTISCLAPPPDILGNRLMTCSIGMEADDEKKYELKWPKEHDPMESNSYMGEKVTVKGVLSKSSGSIDGAVGSVQLESIERR